MSGLSSIADIGDIAKFGRDGPKADIPGRALARFDSIQLLKNAWIGS
jgi:hypothetical protein